MARSLRYKFIAENFSLTPKSSCSCFDIKDDWRILFVLLKTTRSFSRQVDGLQVAEFPPPYELNRTVACIYHLNPLLTVGQTKEESFTGREKNPF